MKAIELSLQKLGLSNKEVQVFLYLLEFGVSLPTNISKKTNIPRSTVYQVLDKLVEKELLIKSTINNILYYECLPIDNLLLKIKEEENQLILKKNILQSILPELKKISENDGFGKTGKIITSFGIEGYKKALGMIDFQKSHKKIFMISSTQLEKKHHLIIDYEKEILREKRKKHGVKMFLLTDNSDLSKVILDRDIVDLRETKVISSDANLETIIVYNNFCVICKDDGDIHTTLIQDESLAHMFSWMFEFIWKKI